MYLAVFGASGPTGLRVVRQALRDSHQVRAVTRRPDAYPISSPDLDVVGADVHDADGVDGAIPGVDAVISTFGVPYSRHAITVYSRGIAHITGAMARHGVNRLVCVSSTTVATQDAPGESLWWRTVVGPVLRHVVGRTLYDDMHRMEEIVRSSGLDWTIVRPGGLFDAAEVTDDYEVSPQRLPGRLTSRADLADLLVTEATEPRYARSTIEVITRSGPPSGRTFLKETFGGG